jgi:CRISPR system Cascade subunit CasA
LDKGTLYGASKLIGELSESSNKLRLFQGRNGTAKTALSYDEAARWLPYLIAFDDTSSKPTRGDTKLPSPGAGWLGKLGILYAMGKNLFETLLLNFVLIDDNGERWETGGAAWELDRPRSAERVEIELPTSQAALLTLQSRRILLKCSRNAVEGFQLLGGDFFNKENAFSEQMTVWRSAKDQEDTYTPKRHNVEKSLWRDFSSLFAKEGGARTPGIVRWLGVLEEENLIQTQQIRLRASAVQYGDKDFFVTDIFDDMLSVNATLFSALGETWILRITHEIEIAEKAVNTLSFFASELAEASGDSRDGAGQRRSAREEAYFRLDVPFRAWLAKIDPQQGDIDDACKAWRGTARQEVLSLGGELVAEAGNRALTGRISKDSKRKDQLITAPKAYNAFVFRVNQTFEYAKEGDH